MMWSSYISYIMLQIIVQNLATQLFWIILNWKLNSSPYPQLWKRIEQTAEKIAQGNETTCSKTHDLMTEK